MTTWQSCLYKISSNDIFYTGHLMKTNSPGIYIIYSRFYVAALVDSHFILVRHDCMVGILCSASRKY